MEHFEGHSKKYIFNFKYLSRWYSRGSIRLCNQSSLLLLKQYKPHIRKSRDDNFHFQSSNQLCKLSNQRVRNRFCMGKHRICKWGNPNNSQSHIPNNLYFLKFHKLCMGSHIRNMYEYQIANSIQLSMIHNMKLMNKLSKD